MRYKLEFIKITPDTILELPDGFVVVSNGPFMRGKNNYWEEGMYFLIPVIE